jgi:hypothetical protein
LSLNNLLRDYINASFSGLWLQTHEPDEALLEIAQLCRDKSWHLATWDLQRGLEVPGGAVSEQTAVGDPLAAITWLGQAPLQGGTRILVMRNLHRLLNNPLLIQAIERQIQNGKFDRTFLLALAPSAELPPELEKLFVVLEHPLPNRSQLQAIAENLVQSLPGMPQPSDFDPIVDAAAGLTRWEAEGAFSLSLVRQGELSPVSIWELKSQMLRKSGLLQMYRGTEGFASLGGLEALKSFCKQALENRHPVAKARGVSLVGVPGSGKSAFAKALGQETGRPTLILDVGSLMGSLVGQTEANIRRALATVDQMAPCILMIDEVEKALAGASGSSGDSGVSARLFGTFLSWLNDHTSEVFTIVTCNDISRLPPEFSRAERFDGVFFVDLPDEQQREAIWQLALEEFRLSEQTRPDNHNWTGAEIRSCCRLAALLGTTLEEAARQVVPIATLAQDTVEKLRQWASGRCIDAGAGGIYRYQRRESNRDSSCRSNRRRLKTVGPLPSTN